MTDRFELAIRGGQVVRPEGTAPLDVYVTGGRIERLEPPDRSHPTDRVVDATGLMILPGMVDTHVHLMDPGDPTREDFPTGTAAAALQGVTSIIEHTHGWPVTDVDRLATKRRHLEGRSYIDYGLAAHAMPQNLGEIPALWRAGVAFFKVFTCSTHGITGMPPDALLQLFRGVAALDGVCLIHCEDHAITAANGARLRAQGRTDPGVIPEWRSREAELVAVAETVLLSRLTQARIVVAHISSTEALEVVRQAQAHGAPVAVETCPQYLFLWEHEVLEDGSLRKFTPPARIRSRSEQEAMWTALNEGAIDLLSSDHAPSTREHKVDGDIWEVHFGLPGLDTTMPLLLDAAFRGQLSLQRLAHAYAEAPSRLYRMTGKGRVTPGFDADLVLVDPNSSRQLTDETVVSRAGWTPYAGREVRGKPIHTFVRGRHVVRNGVLDESAREGAHLPGPGAAESATSLHSVLDSALASYVPSQIQEEGS